MSKRELILIVVALVLIGITACSLLQGDGGEGNNQVPYTDEPEEDSGDGDERQPMIDLGQIGTGDLVTCDGLQTEWITDLQTRQEPEMEEPARRVPFRDPVYGVCVVRVTDRQADIAQGDASRGLKNEYSRLQSFNADGTLILVRSTEADYYLYDATTLRPLGILPTMVEPRWSNTDPLLIYYLDELKLMSYRISSGRLNEVHDFSGDFPGQEIVAVWTRYEGSQSLDDRYWGFMAENADWLTVEFLVYDLQADKIAASLEIAPNEEVDPDSVTISPLGNYFIAQFEYCEQGDMGSMEDPCGLMVYDRDLENGRGLLRIVGHSDIALDADGREVLVYQDIDTDHIAVIDLETGANSQLFPIDFTFCEGCGMHFSGLATQLPGWALVSYFDGDPVSHMWMDDHIFAIELKANARVVHFAFHHSLVNPEEEHDYWAEPHASVNRDFTRILFTTNWGRSGTGEVDMYIVQLPADWPEGLP